MDTKFNDERITYEMGFAKKYSLIIVFFTSLLYFIMKVAYIFIYYVSINNNKLFHLSKLGVAPFTVDIAILLISFLIIVFEKILITKDIKDEMYSKKVSNYYNSSFKKGIIVVYIVYSIFLALLIKNEYAVFLGVDLFNFSIFITLLTSFIYLRTKKTYLNYSIIEEENYYSRVFKNILKFGLIMVLGLLISSVVGVILFINNIKSILPLLFSMLLIYCFSFVFNSIIYLMISIFERICFKNENKTKISLFVILLMIVVITISFFLLVSKLIFSEYGIDRLYNLFGGGLFSEFVADVSYFIENLESLRYFFFAIFVIYLYFDIIKIMDYKKSEQIKPLLKNLFIICLIQLFISGIGKYLKVEVTALEQMIIELKIIEAKQFSNLKIYIDLVIFIIFFIAKVSMLGLIIKKVNKFKSSFIFIIIITIIFTVLTMIKAISGDKIISDTNRIMFIIEITLYIFSICNVNVFNNSINKITDTYV